MTRAGVLANWNGHATDRACTGDEDVLADEIESQSGVDGIAKRIEAGKDIQRNGRIGVPCISRGNGDEFGPGTGAINADALRVRTKMTTAGETIPAMSAGDVAFPDDEVAFGKSAHICSHRCDLTDKFVADCHRHGNGLLRPIIPIINVNISAAD